MRIKTSVIGLLTLGAGMLCAQDREHIPVTLGFKVGVPVTNMFTASNTGGALFGANFLSNGTIPGSNYSSTVPRYTFGVSAEFHLPLHLRFEVDGLYKRGAFSSSAPLADGVAYSRTTFNNWEVPAVFKYNIAMGRFRPFVDFGAALRHISTLGQSTRAPGFNYAQIADNSVALHNRNSFGGVAGIGFTFKRGPFELTPEVRYTRWANESFQATGFRTNLDQGDVLLGISF